MLKGQTGPIQYAVGCEYDVDDIVCTAMNEILLQNISQRLCDILNILLCKRELVNE